MRWKSYKEKSSYGNRKKIHVENSNGWTKIRNLHWTKILLSIMICAHFGQKIWNMIYSEVRRFKILLLEFFKWNGIINVL